MATINPAPIYQDNQLIGYQWSPVTNSDTLAPVFWSFGGGVLSVQGVLNGASATATWSPIKGGTQYPMNTDPAPSGGVISGDASTDVRSVALSQDIGAGWLSMSFSGGGASQSATVVASLPVLPRQG